MIGIKLNAPEWSRAVLNWSNYSTEPLLQAIQDETRGVLERAMMFTPPQGGQGQGKKAVEADIKKIFKTEKSFKSGIFKNTEKRSVGHRWRELLKMNGFVPDNMKALNAIGKNIGMPHMAYRTGGELYKEHERLRTGKNRRPVSRKGRWNKIWLTSSSQLDDYIKRRQKAVGIHKGGWAVAGLKLGMQFSDYVSRNAKYGSYKIHSRGNIIGTESGNKSSGIVEFNNKEKILAKAVEARTRDLTKRLTMAIKGTLDSLQTGGRRFTSHKI